MAKKRKKSRRKRTKKKIVKKSRSSNKRVVPIAFVVGFLIIIFLLSKNEPTDKVIVTNLALEEGENAYIHFDLKHTFSTEKECFAEITLSQGNNALSNTVESLGWIEPNKVVSRTLEIQFPEGDTDFRVDIDCK